MKKNRLSLLLKNELILNWHAIWVAGMTILVLLFLFNLLSPHNVYTINCDPMGFLFLLFVGGFFVTSSAFKYFHQKETSYFFLMLPCENWERFLSKLIFTAVGYPIVTLVIYTLFYWLVGVLVFLFSGRAAFFNPFQLFILKNLMAYVILQSIVLLGSAYFKKYVLMKTALSLASLALILLLFATLVSFLFLKDTAFSVIYFDFVPTLSMNSILSTIATILWLIVAPFCWFVTYQRIKEIEV